MFSAVVSALDESIGRIVQVGFGASLAWSSSTKNHRVAWPFLHSPHQSILVSIWIHWNISKKHPNVSNPSESIWIHSRCSNLLISMRTQFSCSWGTMEGFIWGKVWCYILFDSFWYLFLFLELFGTPSYLLSHFFCSWGTMGACSSQIICQTLSMGRLILFVGENKRTFNLCFLLLRVLDFSI